MNPSGKVWKRNSIMAQLNYNYDYTLTPNWYVTLAKCLATSSVLRCTLTKDWGGYNNFVMHATQIIDNCVYCQCHNNKANLRTSETKWCLRHKSSPISALARISSLFRATIDIVRCAFHKFFLNLVNAVDLRFIYSSYIYILGIAHSGFGLSFRLHLVSGKLQTQFE